MGQVTHAELEEMYFLEIQEKGLATFRSTTLAELDAARLSGEVGATGTGDESTTMRLSPVPIDRRYAAALSAVRRAEEELDGDGNVDEAAEVGGDGFGLNYLKMRAGQ